MSTSASSSFHIYKKDREHVDKMIPAGSKKFFTVSGAYGTMNVQKVRNATREVTLQKIESAKQEVKQLEESLQKLGGRSSSSSPSSAVIDLTI